MPRPRQQQDVAAIPKRSFCTFVLGELFFGLPVGDVQEVVHYQEMTRVPLAPPVIAGLINLRGQIVTALDLRRRLELGERPPETLPCNIVLPQERGGVSLLVDDIGDVVEVDETTFERPPETLSGIGRELIRGAYKLKGRLLLVLDLDRVLKVGGAD